MKILAFELSSPRRSVAFAEWDASGNAVREAGVFEEGPGGMKPLELAGEVMRQAGVTREEIERVAIGLGPGSYTGIRGAIALAQGWELGRGTGLTGVSSAWTTAVAARLQGLRGQVSVVIDAQRGEFYLAGYELRGDQAVETSGLRLASRADVEARMAAGDLLIGPEATKWFSSGTIVHPTAIVAASLARNLDPVPGEKLEPVYLREVSFVKAPPPRAIPPIRT